MVSADPGRTKTLAVGVILGNNGVSARRSNPTEEQRDTGSNHTMTESELTLARESLRRICDDFDGSLPPGWERTTINLELALSWAIKAQRFLAELYEHDTHYWSEHPTKLLQLAALVSKTKEYVTVRLRGTFFYISGDGKGQWRITTQNGKPVILPGCGTAFSSRADAMRALEEAVHKIPG